MRKLRYYSTAENIQVVTFIFFRKAFWFKTQSVTDQCGDFINHCCQERTNTSSREETEGAYITSVYDEIGSGSRYATLTSQDCGIHEDLLKNTSVIGTKKIIENRTKALHLIAIT